VISDPDIFRAAKLLIDQHGDDAELSASGRAEELLEAEGQALLAELAPVISIGEIAAVLMPGALRKLASPLKT